MANIELKPCPFCGETEISFVASSDGTNCNSFECDCGCTFHLGTEHREPSLENIEQWNKRA